MRFAKSSLAVIGAVVMAAGAMLFAQGTDAAKVLADMRQALGGEKKLAAVRALSATGKSQRSVGETSMGGDYEMLLELPDKFFTKQAMGQTPMGPIAVTLGFNGAGLIQETELPPQLAGMNAMIRIGGSSPNATPEQQAADRDRQVRTAKQDFARMALGLFGASFGAYPLEFSAGGTAESPDGEADVINIKGPDDFAGKLFVDHTTHLPLMFSWMAKEPLQVSSVVGGPGHAGTGPGITQMSHATTPEERDKLMKEMDDRMKDADARRKVVEYRMFYGDYQSVAGIQLPHHIQQSVAGNAATEWTIEKYKVNPAIDPKRFEIVK